MVRKFLGFASPPRSVVAQTLACRARGPGFDPRCRQSQTFPLIFPIFSPQKFKRKFSSKALGLNLDLAHELSTRLKFYIVSIIHTHVQCRWSHGSHVRHRSKECAILEQILIRHECIMAYVTWQENYIDPCVWCVCQDFNDIKKNTIVWLVIYQNGTVVCLHTELCFVYLLSGASIVKCECPK